MVGKGENAGYWHFLFSPQCFQKPPELLINPSPDNANIKRPWERSLLKTL